MLPFDEQNSIYLYLPILYKVDVEAKNTTL